VSGWHKKYTRAPRARANERTTLWRGRSQHRAPGDEVMARKWRSDLELRRASSCHDGTSDCHRLYTMAPLAAAASPLFGLLRRPSQSRASRLVSPHREGCD
jgi:hypothetical protein